MALQSVIRVDTQRAGERLRPAYLLATCIHHVRGAGVARLSKLGRALVIGRPRELMPAQADPGPPGKAESKRDALASQSRGIEFRPIPTMYSSGPVPSRDRAMDSPVAGALDTLITPTCK